MKRIMQPLPAGQKRKRESWETVWYIGMYGTMGLTAVLLYYKPDTRCVPFSAPPTSECSRSLAKCSIQSWALQEAKARMEARGEKPEL